MRPEPSALPRRSGVALCAALVLFGARGAAAPSSALAPVQTMRLANGLTLLVVEDHRSPLVWVKTLYRFGSGQNPPGRPGLAHLIEHMLVLEMPVPDPKARTVAELEVRGVTRADTTTYETEVRPADVGIALWSEAMRLTAFDRTASMERVLPIARQSVRNEEQDRWDAFGTWPIFSAAGRLLFPEGHPYREVWARERDTADTATLAEAEAFHARYYWPNNAIVAVVGDVDAGEVQSLAQRYLGPLPSGPAAPEVQTPAAPGGDRRVAIPTDRAGRPEVCIVYPVPSVYDVDGPEAELAWTILRDELDDQLVHARGLIDLVDGGLGSRRKGNWLRVLLRPRPGHSAEEVIAAYDRVLKDLISRRPAWPSATALTAARRRISLDRTSAFERFSARADELLNAQYEAGAARAWWSLDGRIKAATATAVHDVVARYFVPAARAIIERRPNARPPAEPTLAPTPAPAPAGSRRSPLTFPTPAPSSSYLLSVNLADQPLERFVLSNGLRVVLLPVRDLPLVDATLVVNAGAGQVPPAKLGLARATAELVYRGTHDRTALQLDKAIGELGARLSVRTDWATTELRLETLSSSLEPALALWAEAIERPRFDDDELDLWKRRHLSAEKSSGPDAVTVSERALRQRLFPASSGYAWPQTGTARTLRALTREDLERFHLTQYHPGNATLIVVGDVGREALEPLLEAHLGSWEARARIEPPPAPPGEPPPGPMVVLVDVPGQSHASIRFGTLGLAPSSIDRARAQSVATQVLARLERALRAPGLSYDASVSFTADPQASVFQIGASVDPPRVGEAVRVITTVLNQVRARPWDASYPQGVALQDLLRDCETRAGLEKLLEAGVIFDLGADPIRRQATAIDLAGPWDVQRMAARMLAPARLVLVVAGDARIIEPQLTSLGQIARVSSTP